MTLNTAIKSWQIQPATISGGHLVVSNSVSGTQILSYDANEDSFKWDYLATVTINEVPSGDIDGSNKEFTLANTPLEDSERVYLNGLLQEPGSGKDYTIDGNKITFTTAPESGDVVLVSYLIEKKSSVDTYANIPYGYESGGRDLYREVSSTDRITFPFDSGIATLVGTLSLAVASNVGANSSSHGYSMGGSTGAKYSSIQRFSFPFDSGNATIVGNLPLEYEPGAGVNSSIHAFALGGTGGLSIINRIQFPFNSGTALSVGNLSSIRTAMGGGANNSRYGYTLGGYVSSVVSTIDRIQFPFNSGTASHVGDLSETKSSVSGFNSSAYGYSAAGAIWPAYTSSIDRFQFPFDIGTAIHIGNLAGSIRGAGGVNSTIHGFIMGGEVAEGNWNTISSVYRAEFPFDSGTAVVIGNLSINRKFAASIDGTDFVSMFV